VTIQPEEGKDLAEDEGNIHRHRLGPGERGGSHLWRIVVAETLKRLAYKAESK
jgi:hypothetical protein